MWRHERWSACPVRAPYVGSSLPQSVAERIILPRIRRTRAPLRLPEAVDTWGLRSPGDLSCPSPQQQPDRQARRRLAVLRHAEEVTGSVSQPCRYHGISRNCFYKWLRRYQEEGVDGIGAAGGGEVIVAAGARAAGGPVLGRTGSRGPSSSKPPVDDASADDGGRRGHRAQLLDRIDQSRGTRARALLSRL
ncbi:helix-turn-helix domain-containing protein [Spinactinospora alkalitolerans]|uniref:helix-turn-helix domain-containing protein n=1 Tax=Spinactinospora alkalitolerans TaxID=687207 RepID=UPI0035E44833